MSDFSVEQKLELVQQIRSQYYRNQSDLMNREHILYGRTQIKSPEQEYYNYNSSSTDTEENLLTDNTVKIRYLLSAVLLLLVILFDKSGTTLAGISMEEIFTMIETDYEEVVETWADSLIVQE